VFKVSPIITNFMSGELSHKLDGRTDLPQYYSGCSILENMIPLPQGGVTKSPGTWYIAEARQAGSVRLIPFIVSADEAFVLEFGAGYIRFYQNRIQVQSAGVPVEVATPYTTDELFDLKYVMLSNTEMLIVHHNHPIQSLVYGGSPTAWTFGAYSLATGAPSNLNGGAGDYPAVIAIHENRLVLGATDNHPNYVWLSEIGVYNNFTLVSPPTSKDPCEFELLALKDAHIMWILSVYSHLLIGAASGEAYLVGVNGIITPLVGGAVFKRTSNFGSNNIQAKLIDGSVIFVQRHGNKVINYYWSNEFQSYVSPDLTLLADHIGGSTGFKEFAYQNYPYNIIWFVRQDGQLALLVLQKEAKTMGWCRITCNGQFNSVAVIPGENGDDVYVAVSRTINGSDVQYIEVFDPIDMFALQNVTYLYSTVLWDGGSAQAITNITNADPAVVTTSGTPPSDGDLIKIQDVEGMTEVNDNVYQVKNVVGSTFELWTIDGGSSIDSSSFGTYSGGGNFKKVTAKVTGLSHLEGEEVKINADGGSVEPQTVSSGEITLSNYYNKIYVGLWKDAVVRPMRIEITLPTGTTQTKVKRINQVRFRMFNTLGGKVGYDLNHLSPILYDRQYLGVTPSHITGDKFISFAGNYSTEGWIYVVQDEPLPMTILSIMPDMGVYGLGG